ncbi:MAG: LemA family protein [Verrucomicrobia bacterium]|nr:LemA family protein [Verrucomicrobiota bacterium]MDA1087339.1 LemA family protein [Verrucomicrobiota bacterium]
MQHWTWIALAAMPFAALGFLYNRLVRHRNLLREAWSGIDVQLKRRHVLVPNLVEVVKSYAHHEADVLEEVTRARTESQRASAPDAAEAGEVQLTRALKSVLLLVENYPDLKANGNFLDLQHKLVDIEDQIQMARRYYNGTVRDYNTLVESFPANIVAGIFRFAPRDYFEIETATERLAPRIDLP